MNKNYIAGRNFEYARAKAWRAKGYTVVRSAGSHGVWDLCAVRADYPVELIQCKKLEGERQAYMLIRKFKQDPPLAPSKRYHLTIEVLDAETGIVHSGTI